MNISNHTKNKSEPIQIIHNKQSKHFPIEINALTTVSNIIKHHQLSFFSQSNHSVVPPYEINGNGTPTTGKSPVTIPILIKTYKAKLTPKPVANTFPK